MDEMGIMNCGVEGLAGRVLQGLGEGSGMVCEKRERILLRPWLENLINSGKIPGLEWINTEKTLFKVPWKHRSKKTWSQRHSSVFLEWAKNTGRWNEGDPPPNYAQLKTRLRCAFNKAPDIQEMKEYHFIKSEEPYKVYRFIPRRASADVSTFKSRLSSLGRKAWTRSNALSMSMRRRRMFVSRSGHLIGSGEVMMKSCDEEELGDLDLADVGTIIKCEAPDTGYEWSAMGTTSGIDIPKDSSPYEAMGSAYMENSLPAINTLKHNHPYNYGAAYMNNHGQQNNHVSSRDVRDVPSSSRAVKNYYMNETSYRGRGDYQASNGSCYSYDVSSRNLGRSCSSVAQPSCYPSNGGYRSYENGRVVIPLTVEEENHNGEVVYSPDSETRDQSSILPPVDKPEIVDTARQYVTAEDIGAAYNEAREGWGPRYRQTPSSTPCATPGPSVAAPEDRFRSLPLQSPTISSFEQQQPSFHNQQQQQQQLLHQQQQEQLSFKDLQPFLVSPRRTEFVLGSGSGDARNVAMKPDSDQLIRDDHSQVDNFKLNMFPPNKRFRLAPQNSYPPTVISSLPSSSSPHVIIDLHHNQGDRRPILPPTNSNPASILPSTSIPLPSTPVLSRPPSPLQPAPLSSEAQARGLKLEVRPWIKSADNDEGAEADCKEQEFQKRLSYEKFFKSDYCAGFALQGKGYEDTESLKSKYGNMDEKKKCVKIFDSAATNMIPKSVQNNQYEKNKLNDLYYKLHEEKLATNEQKAFWVTANQTGPIMDKGVAAMKLLPSKKSESAISHEAMDLTKRASAVVAPLVTTPAGFAGHSGAQKGRTVDVHVVHPMPANVRGQQQQQELEEDLCAAKCSKESEVQSPVIDKKPEVVEELKQKAEAVVTRDGNVERSKFEMSCVRKQSIINSKSQYLEDLEKRLTAQAQQLTEREELIRLKEECLKKLENGVPPLLDDDDVIIDELRTRTRSLERNNEVRDTSREIDERRDRKRQRNDDEEVYRVEGKQTFNKTTVSYDYGGQSKAEINNADHFEPMKQMERLSKQDNIISTWDKERNGKGYSNEAGWDKTASQSEREIDSQDADPSRWNKGADQSETKDSNWTIEQQRKLERLQSEYMAITLELKRRGEAETRVRQGGQGERTPPDSYTNGVLEPTARDRYPPSALYNHLPNTSLHPGTKHIPAQANIPSGSGIMPNLQKYPGGYSSLEQSARMGYARTLDGNLPKKMITDEYSEELRQHLARRPVYPGQAYIPQHPSVSNMERNEFSTPRLPTADAEEFDGKELRKRGRPKGSKNRNKLFREENMGECSSPYEVEENGMLRDDWSARQPMSNSQAYKPIKNTKPMLAIDERFKLDGSTIHRDEDDGEPDKRILPPITSAVNIRTVTGMRNEMQPATANVIYAHSMSNSKMASCEVLDANPAVAASHVGDVPSTVLKLLATAERSVSSVIPPLSPLPPSGELNNGFFPFKHHLYHSSSDRNNNISGKARNSGYGYEVEAARFGKGYEEEERINRKLREDEARVFRGTGSHDRNLLNNV